MENDLQALIRQAQTGRGAKSIDVQTLRQVISVAGAQGLMTIRVEVFEEQGELLAPRVDLTLYGLYSEPEIQAASPPERIRLSSQAVDEMLKLTAREAATFQFELWLDEAAYDTP